MGYRVTAIPVGECVPEPLREMDHDNTVCSACLREVPYLARLIRRWATAHECTYCGRSSKKPIAVPFAELMGVIRPAVEAEYEDAAESVPHESREGGYQMATLMTSEVVEELGIWSDSEELLDDIVSALPDNAWVEVNPFSLSPYDVLFYGWDKFSDTVKHETRYLFFETHKRVPGAIADDEIKPADMLAALGQLIRDLGLVSTVPAGTELFRVRQHEPTITPDSMAELGPPPTEKALYANRMSPAGIAMLYVSFDAATAFDETVDLSRPGFSKATTATLQATRSLRVLDLSDLPEVPSVFHTGISRAERHAIAFVHAFAADLTRPVERDGRQHVEYVPSQVVTEYCRYRFRTAKGKRLNGIVYPSAVEEGGKSAVLFFSAADCAVTDVIGHPQKPPVILRAVQSVDL